MFYHFNKNLSYGDFDKDVKYRTKCGGLNGQKYGVLYAIREF